MVPVDQFPFEPLEDWSSSPIYIAVLHVLWGISAHTISLCFIVILLVCRSFFFLYLYPF